MSGEESNNEFNVNLSINKSDNEQPDNVQAIAEQPKPEQENVSKPKKKDGRSESSKRNLIKAREARHAKYKNKVNKYKELFGSDSEESESNDELFTSSDSDNSFIPTKYQKKKMSKQQKDINELKDIVFKLAEKQKKYREKKSKYKNKLTYFKNNEDLKDKYISPQPIVNYNIQPPPQPEPKEPKKEQYESPFLKSLRNKILDN